MVAMPALTVVTEKKTTAAQMNCTHAFFFFSYFNSAVEFSCACVNKC